MLNNEMKLSDIGEHQRELAEVLGLEAYRKLIWYCGGETIYIPLCAESNRKSRNQMLMDEFDGSNFRELARKYSLSERRVRRILKEMEGMM